MSCPIAQPSAKLCPSCTWSSRARFGPPAWPPRSGPCKGIDARERLRQTMLNLLQRVERGFALLGRWMVVCFMAITLAFTAGQAADRYVLHSPFNAYDQIATLA